MTTTTVEPSTTRRERAAGTRRVGPAGLALVGVAFLILVGLGVWQLQRLAWKTQLLRQIAALQSAPPQPLGPALARLSSGAEVDFTRVQTTCPTLERTPTLRLYALRDRMGYRLITACPTAAGPYRSILVDRGFVAREAVDRVRPEADLGATPIVGVLRRGDPATLFTPKHTSPHADWYGRDVPAMAAALGAPAPAPIFLMLERPAPQGFGPTPAPLPQEIRNPHLGYAITWFGLAAALAGVCGAALLRRSART